MQEAKEKTGVAGRRGALIGPEAWLEGGGGKVFVRHMGGKTKKMRTTNGKN